MEQFKKILFGVIVVALVLLVLRMRQGPNRSKSKLELPLPVSHVRQVTNPVNNPTSLTTPSATVSPLMAPVSPTLETTSEKRVNETPVTFRDGDGDLLAIQMKPICQSCKLPKEMTLSNERSKVQITVPHPNSTRLTDLKLRPDNVFGFSGKCGSADRIVVILKRVQEEPRRFHYIRTEYSLRTGGIQSEDKEVSEQEFVQQLNDLFAVEDCEILTGQ